MDTKICLKCEKEKPLSEFTKKAKNRDGYNTRCKLCTRETVRKHYKNNVDYYVKKAAKNKKINLEANKHKLLDYFSSQTCVDCGEDNPLVLQFDHADPKEKKHNVSMMLETYTWNTILSEIDKCSVRCANCHLIRTAHQFGWWKTKTMHP